MVCTRSHPVPPDLDRLKDRTATGAFFQDFTDVQQSRAIRSTLQQIVECQTECFRLYRQLCRRFCTPTQRNPSLEKQCRSFRTRSFRCIPRKYRPSFARALYHSPNPDRRCSKRTAENYSLRLTNRHSRHLTGAVRTTSR